MVSRKQNQQVSVRDIADMLQADVVGTADLTVGGVEFIERADETELAFIGCEKNLSRIATAKSRVIIAPRSVADRLEAYPEKTFLLVDEPEADFLQVALKLVPPRPRSSVGISQHAVIAESAVIGAKSNVHPTAVVGEDVVIGEGCDIGAGAVIGDGCQLGDDVVIGPNAVLYPDVVLGSKVVIQAGVVLGAEGFGYRTVNGRHELLPHVGTVRIADDVHVGANTTIDRAKMGETSIDSGTRIDNLVMIAHNCQLGPHNLIVGQAGLAGSTTSGAYVVCAGQAGIADHVHLGDGAIIGAKTGVHKDMAGGKAYLGIPARDAVEHAREQMALKRLPEMRSTVRRLEKQIAELQQQLVELTEQLSPRNSGVADNRDAA